MFKMQQLLNRGPPHLILSLMMLGFITLTAGSYLRPGTVRLKCCESVSRKNFSFDIKRYRIQHEMKPCVKAIILYTKEKGPLCTHPKARWVPKKIKKLLSAARLPQSLIEFLH
ncbi:uncharacterized protein LOC144484282 [Mustelus asterias]